MVDIGVEESNPDFIEWQGTCQPSPCLPYREKKKKKKKEEEKTEEKEKKKKKSRLTTGYVSEPAV